MSPAVDTMKRLYRLIRRIPIAGLVVTGVVRLGKALVVPVGPGFDGLADEVHVVGASLQALRADVDQLALIVAALNAARTGKPPPMLQATGLADGAAQAAASAPITAILARDEATPLQQIALDLNTGDRSGLIAEITTCPQAALGAATIPLSGCETPETVCALAQALAKAMRDRAVLCVRLLDYLSVFLASPRDQGANHAARRISPQLVLETFEQQGCRLIGLRRGTAGTWPTVDLIIEMRES